MKLNKPRVASILDAVEQKDKNESKVGGPKVMLTHLLVFRVFRANDIHPSLPSNNTTSITHNLDGGTDLHPSCQRWRVRNCWRDMVRDMCVVVGERKGCSAHARD